jgi:tetratricopeptide (TPR) repeat protein
MKFFQKKEIYKVKSVPMDPASVNDPSTASEYHRRGVAYYARKQYDSAIEDLKKATILEGNMVDAFYSLGMVYKAMNRKEEAVENFQKVVELIAAEGQTGKVSADMLRRLALGHMNELTQGDWNLEKEIWKHID